MFLYNKMAKQGHEESIATQQKSLFLPGRCHSVQTPENIDPHFGEQASCKALGQTGWKVCRL